MNKPDNRTILVLNYKMLCQYYSLNCIDQCCRIKVYNPKMDDNPRIIAQSGLLAYIPTINSLESVIESCFGEIKKGLKSPSKNLVYSLRINF